MNEKIAQLGLCFVSRFTSGDILQHNNHGGPCRVVKTRLPNTDNNVSFHVNVAVRLLHTVKSAIMVIYCSYDNNCVSVRSNKDINITQAASLQAPGTQPSYLSKHIGQISAAGCVELCYPLTCFEEDNLIVLTEVHEASDALGKLHHIVNSVGDVDGTLLPHRFCWLKGQKEMRTVSNYSNHMENFCVSKQWRFTVLCHTRCTFIW